MKEMAKSAGGMKNPFKLLLKLQVMLARPCAILMANETLLQARCLACHHCGGYMPLAVGDFQSPFRLLAVQFFDCKAKPQPASLSEPGGGGPHTTSHLQLRGRQLIPAAVCRCLGPRRSWRQPATLRC